MWSELTGPRLPWCRLRVLIEQLPEGCALTRSRLGERASWTLNEQLLVKVIHALELSLWQRADPKKRGQAPKPIQTPWSVKPKVNVERLLDFHRRDAERRKEVE